MEVGVNRRAPYQDVRALERGLRIMEALSQHGWTTPRTLSDITRIDRSSTYRLLNTLVSAGYVAKRGDGAFSLTAKINTMVDGLTNNELASQIVAPHLQQLTKEIAWPCDYAVLLGGEVTIVESTHRISPMTTYRSMIGKKRPLFLSSLGAAILSAMTEDELDITLNVVAKMGGVDSDITRLRKIAEKTLREVKELGYAAAAGTTDPKISAIALPVRAPNLIIGAVNIIFFRSAMTIEQAAERYLGSLRACVERIKYDFSEKLVATDTKNRWVRKVPQTAQRPVTNPRQARRSSSRSSRSSSPC